MIGGGGGPDGVVPQHSAAWAEAHPHQVLALILHSQSQNELSSNEYPGHSTWRLPLPLPLPGGADGGASIAVAVAPEGIFYLCTLAEELPRIFKFTAFEFPCSDLA